MIHTREYAIGEIVDGSIVTEYTGTDNLPCNEFECRYKYDDCPDVRCLANERNDEKPVYFKPIKQEPKS